MQTVCETHAFRAAAKAVDMAREDGEAVVQLVASNPEVGDVMQGTGGCRKLRFGGRGKGKSGGYRVVTFLTGLDLPVFLLTVFGKGEKANLSKAECNALTALAQTLSSIGRSGAGEKERTR